jgi:hypothetical protein
MAVRVAGFAVTVMLAGALDTPLRLAVMLAVPAATPLTEPPWTVATELCEDAQLTELVMSFVV